MPKKSATQRILLQIERQGIATIEELTTKNDVSKAHIYNMCHNTNFPITRMPSFVTNSLHNYNYWFTYRHPRLELESLMFYYDMLLQAYSKTNRPAYREMTTLLAQKMLALAIQNLIRIQMFPEPVPSMFPHQALEYVDEISEDIKKAIKYGRSDLAFKPFKET